MVLHAGRALCSSPMANRLQARSVFLIGGGCFRPHLDKHSPCFVLTRRGIVPHPVRPPFRPLRRGAKVGVRTDGGCDPHAHIGKSLSRMRTDSCAGRLSAVANVPPGTDFRRQGGGLAQGGEPVMYSGLVPPTRGSPSTPRHWYMNGKCLKVAKEQSAASRREWRKFPQRRPFQACLRGGWRVLMQADYIHGSARCKAVSS